MQASMSNAFCRYQGFQEILWAIELNTRLCLQALQIPTLKDLRFFFATVLPGAPLLASIAKVSFLNGPGNFVLSPLPPEVTASLQSYEHKQSALLSCHMSTLTVAARLEQFKAIPSSTEYFCPADNILA